MGIGCRILGEPLAGKRRLVQQEDQGLARTGSGTLHSRYPGPLHQWWRREQQGCGTLTRWNDRVGKDFTYGLSLNASYNKNEVTRIANSEGIIHGNEGAIASVNAAEFYRAQVGYPIGYFWGYQTAGVFQNQKQIDDWKAAGNGVHRPTLNPAT